MLVAACDHRRRAVAFVITQNCCKEASWVPVCPVDCIRPVDDSTDMLFIDLETCIDCGACMDECPVDAIYYEEDLLAEQLNFLQMNAEYSASILWSRPRLWRQPSTRPSRRAHCG
jgi:NAD-dependent dihydropyrimidine dehydrogenase PreA subunit